ncbi:MAG: ABC transporter ATP-binding protein [Bacteroidota bacterium]
MEDTIVEIDGLSVGYQSHRLVLHDLSLRVKKNSVFGFLGRNGAGKSTLIKTLMGLLHPQMGSVRLFGQTIKDNRKEVLSRVGSLIDSPSIYGYLTGIENLRIYGKYHRIGENRIKEVLDIVGLEDNADRKAKTYSTGMRQRLGLGMAILHDPEFLILDEPTNGLDPEGRVDFLNTMSRLHNEGKTILISSHLLSEIERIVTHVGILNDKKFLFHGSVNELYQFNQKSRMVRFKVSNPQFGLELLEGIYNVSKESEDGYISVQTENKDDTPEIIKTLTANQIDIYAVIPNKNSLEELFIESVK